MRNIIKIIIAILIVASCSKDDTDPVNRTAPLAICIDGIAIDKNSGVSYHCNNYDLISHVSLKEMGAESGNDCWGWTDNLTGKEYAIMGVNNGTIFVDISDPLNPFYIGKLPTATIDSSWRDLKVYNDHVFIVSEAEGHGLQIFDLSKLRDVQSRQIFSADYLYTGYGHAHNIGINEKTGYAYTAGSGRSNSPVGIHALNIKNPKNPKLELTYSDIGYSHDVQVEIYNGPDIDYLGQEIYIGSNENKVVLVDVTDKKNPKIISAFYYDHQYTHQSWLTTDHKYLLMGDELDELDSSYQSLINKTRTIIIDLTDLDNPIRHFDYYSETDAIDHNGYVVGSKFYLASYTAGLRVLDISNINEKQIKEIGFFDTHNDGHNHGVFKITTNKEQDPGGDHSGKKGNIEAFNGAWSVYPFFNSENIVISDINSGLFIVKRKN